MVTNPQDTNETPLRVRRGRVESVDLYEIKETELEIFRKGSPADLQLNFAIFLLSVAFGSIVALSTATFSNPNIHTTFIFVAVVGVLLGIYLLIAWYRNRTSLVDVCDVIRQRIKPDLLITSKTTSVTEITSAPPDEPPKG